MDDLRYAARKMAKSPGFTLIFVALLGAGIGANTVIFSALDAVLLRPLPVKYPEKLVSPRPENFSARHAQQLRISAL